MTEHIDDLKRIRQMITDQLADLKERSLKKSIGADEYRGIGHGRNAMYAILREVDDLIQERQNTNLD